MSNPHESRAIGALVAGAVGIAFAPIFVRYAGHAGVGPSAAAFYRLAFAAPVAWLWAWRQPSSARRPTTLSERLQLCLPGLCFAGDLAVWHWSILWTSVANATLLANFAPVFVTLLGWFLFRRRVRGLFVAGMATALVGAVLLVGESQAQSAQQFRGDLLGMLTALFYASYFVSVGWLRERFTTPTILAYAVTVAAVVLGPVAVVSGEPLGGYSAGGWGSVIGLAVVSQILGQGLIIYALAHLPAHFSSVTLLLQPALAAVLAWWLFAERPNLQQAMGGLIMLAGILVARRGSR
ncbi:MAG: DMT family transporter [Planctomycetota bacterium]